MPHHDNHFSDLDGKVVVITGASAGVGRAAARRFVLRGATVALIGRDLAALENTRAELTAIGGRAACYPLDVADAEAVFSAANAVENELGPIDVWVNNAMATVFSPVSRLSAEEIRRVTEVTYLGCVHGTLAALGRMRQRDAGVIVQVGSSLAYRGIPLQAAYCGAKHAIRGFTDAVRAELLHDRSAVRLTAVHLPAINTPQFDWARTKRAKQPRPVAPVYDAAVAGRAIVHAACYPAREYWLSSGTVATILGNMIAPGLMDRIVASQAFEGQDREQDVEPGRRDNLDEPVVGLHRTDGAFDDEVRYDAVLVSSALAKAAVGLAIGAAGFAIAARLGAGLRNGWRGAAPAVAKARPQVERR